MKNIKSYFLILQAVFLFAVAGAALFFSYNAYRSSIAVEKKYRQFVGQLEHEIAGLKAQLATIQVQAEDDSTHTKSKSANAVPLKSKEDPVGSQREAVRHLEKIVESTGLEQLAANEDMDPTVLSEMYAEFADRRQAVLQREQLLQINSELHKADEDQYIEFYLAHQYLRQGNTDNALALIESLEKNYPDSRLFTGRFGTGRRWQPVSQVIPRLRQEVELAR